MATRNLLNDNPDTAEELSLPYDEAVKYIKGSRNRQIFLGGTQFIYTKDDADKGYRMPFNVPVNAAAALQVLGNIYSTSSKFKTECVVKLSVSKHCLFIN